MPKSRFFWFVNGALFATLVFSATNCLSYFFRSQNLGMLIGAIGSEEAIGFPFQIWSSLDVYPGLPLATRAVLLNAACGLTEAVVAGVICASSKNFLNRFLIAMEASENSGEPIKLQFSVRGMLTITAVAAVVAALIRQTFGARPELLLAVYLLGPASWYCSR